MSRRPNTEARECILRTAFRLFCQKGFKGVSVEDVAQAAGMKKANVFHYYPSKDALGEAVFDSGSRFLKEQFSTSLAKGKGDPLRAVQAVFDDIICAMDEDCCSGGCFVGNTAQEMSGESESLRKKIAGHLDNWMRELKDLF